MHPLEFEQLDFDTLALRWRVIVGMIVSVGMLAAVGMLVVVDTFAAVGMFAIVGLLADSFVGSSIGIVVQLPLGFGKVFGPLA